MCRVLTIKFLSINSMKKVLTSLLVGVTFAFAGCIDREFDIAKTSGEITIGGEELVVPLGEISPIYLKDIIEENESFKSDENGNYRIIFSSSDVSGKEWEEITVDGISVPDISIPKPNINPVGFSFQQLPTQLSLSGISKEFDVDIPTIGNIMEVEPIKLVQDINIQLPSVPIPGVTLGQQGTISERIASYLPAITTSMSEQLVFDAELSILEQLKKVDWVEFGCDEHPYGAPFELKIDLKGLQDVNGGGVVNLKVEFPLGYYLRDEDGRDYPEDTHNVFEKNVTINPKQESVNFLVYLHRIDYSDHTFVDGMLKIDDYIKYSYDISFNLCAGNYNLNNAPKFSVESAPKCKDVEIVINHFEVPALEESLAYSFSGLPSTVSVDKIAFTENTELTIRLAGLEWLVVKDNLTDENLAPYIEIGMPKCMHFRSNALLKENNMLVASTADLAKGVKLSLEYIDCNAESVEQQDGMLSINEKISTSVHLEVLDNHTILASSLTPPTNFKVEVAIAESNLFIDTNNTVVSWSGNDPFDFNLQDQIPSLSQTIDVPEMISSIERIAIGKAGSDSEPFAVTFAFGTVNGSTFPVDELEVDVVVNLGKMLRPTDEMLKQNIIQKGSNGDYLLVVNEDWRPNEKALSRTVKFEALENIPAIVDGKLAINQSFPVAGSVKIKNGEHIDLAAISDAKIAVDVDIDDIAIRSFTGGVNIAVEPEKMDINLGAIGDLGVKINSLNLNPIFHVQLDNNPTGIPFSADIAIKTFNSKGEQMRTITIPTITIAGTGGSDIVLSTPRNAVKYEGIEGVTFIAIDNLADLLTDGIPAKMSVDMSVASNSSDIYTIDLSQASKGYALKYKYDIELPLEFDGDVDISYEGAISGLNSVFVALADATQELTVGDVGLIAEFGTTIPFNVVVSAELVNADGTTENLGAALNINKCLIKGHDSNGSEKSISRVDLDFDLGGSHSLEGLRNADGIKLKFSLYSTGVDVSALSKNQYVDAKLKLRVRNGLTVDISELLKGNKEE